MSAIKFIEDYFKDMGFFHNEEYLGPRLIQKKTRWTILVYVLVSLGIFCRQITNFPTVSMNMTNFNFSVFAASMIVGFAILPYVMKKISRKKPKLSYEHTLSAFGIGFFIDLTNSILLKFFA